MKLTAYAPAISQSVSLNASPATSALREKHAQIARQKLEAQKQALTTLKQHTESRKDEAKALAKKRVDQLKERLKMLEQMPSLDPAKKARLIAQLTKELKSAVKAYGAAGGSSAEIGTGASAPSPTSPAPQASETPTTTTEDTASDSGESEPRDPAQTTPYDTAASRQTDDRTSREAEEDAAFARDVRDMMRKIKAQLDKAKAVSNRDNTSEDIKDAEDALRALDDEIGAIESSAAATGLTSGLMLSLSI
ncbi:MAG: hypothetical protein AAGC58_03960 [Asticcacaulis sp.]